MIVSITCRHHTETKVLRHQAHSECLSLTRYIPNITRVQVIFSKSHRAGPTDVVTCHLLIQIPHKRPVYIHDEHANSAQALSRAMDQAAHQLSRLQTRCPAYS